MPKEMSESLKEYQDYLSITSPSSSGKLACYTAVIAQIGTILRKVPGFEYVPEDFSVVKNLDLIYKAYVFICEEQKKTDGGVFKNSSLAKSYWDARHGFCSAAVKDFLNYRITTYKGPIETALRRFMASQTRMPINVSIQLITYGAPGTGKSWDVKQETQGRSCIRTTFHPDSDYSTFVGAYKPAMEKDDYETVVTTGEKSASGNISRKDGLVRQKRIVYRFVAQAFLEAYVEAWRKCSGFLSAQDENEKAANVQFLVIEEINRGNCAQVFGDIFQLLDREDDGYSAYAIQADSDLRQYLEEAFQSLDLAGVGLGNRDVTPEEIKSGEKMLLPPNLLIRATMNTSDQSLFPMDSAFKRRWDWKYVPIRNHPEEDYRIEIGGETYRWWPFITEINKRIVSATESEDKKLGYFFVKAEKGSDGKNVIDADKFLNKVVFYLWNDVFKNSESEKAFKFERPDGKKDIAAFQDFFKEEDGSRDDGMLKAFLKGLGVEAVAEEGQENAAGNPASPVEDSPAPTALPPGAAE